MTEEIAIGADFDQWAIVELMGHVRTTGKLTEVEHFGSKLGRLEVVDSEGKIVAVQYFGGGSVYRITVCDEQTARDLARPMASHDVPWDMRDKMRQQIREEMQEEEARMLEEHRRDDEDLAF